MQGVTSVETIKGKGLKDNAIICSKDDKLELNSYVDGLSEFIKTCETPMTLAIQGDWGTGKSSMMNMIKERLGGDVHSVFFNTWQYSQFGMEEELTVAFLDSLVKQIDDMDGAAKDLKKIVSVVGRLLKKATIIGTERIVGQKAAEYAEEVMAKDYSLEHLNAVTVLKEQFEKVIKAKGRVVIFVDDLDRLKPYKAVELLEVIKNFLDCENCIFVLAIDKEVVYQGIREKYGGLITKKKVDQFFDKIIQIAFRLPVEQYKLDNYIFTCLEKTIDGNVKRADIVDYVTLIDLSVGHNPRSIKRIFNLFKLHNLILKNRMKMDTYFDDKVLFAVLCLQESYNDRYDELVRKDVLNKSICNEFIDEVQGREDIDFLEKRFLKVFNSLLNENNISTLEDILKQTEITDISDKKKKKMNLRQYFVKMKKNGKTVILKFIEHGKKYEGIPALMGLMTRIYLNSHSIEQFNEIFENEYDIIEGEKEKFKGRNWSENGRKYCLAGPKGTDGDFRVEAFETFIEKIGFEKYVAESMEELIDKEYIRENINENTGYRIVSSE